MKEYQAKSIKASAPLMLMAPFAIIADYADDLFSWAYDVFFLALLLCVMFYVLTPYKYFPLFSSLCIDDRYITKRLFGIYVTRKLDRNQVHINHLILHGEYYVVFSRNNIPASLRDVLHAVHLRQAILYPWKPNMGKDFPELFR